MKLKEYLRNVFFITIMYFITVCVGVPCACADSFAVTSPWLNEITAFIIKDKGIVRSLSRWDEHGNVIISSYPHKNEIIIAVNESDAKKFKITIKNKNLRILYRDNDVNNDKIRKSFYDPAMLPFIAQKVMNIVVDSDKERYRFYQRRLAEFQSRINSTLDIGRHLLSDITILDLSGAEGIWIQASARSFVTPPDALMNDWLKGEILSLKETLKETQKRGWIVITDPWTPPHIRELASKYPHCVHLPAPSADKDYFAYLHEMIMSIWNTAKDK